MTAAIRFVMGDRLVTLERVEPTMTVLQWLRASGRTGTKEGCAEGDCGACTVVLGEPAADGGIAWKAVNACILLLPQLDGKALVTVEDLAENGALHPVQAAMVEAHAAQCGFCTPGFVMALFALWRSGRPADEATVQDALAGNLCRCTGYRPILDAARTACGSRVPDRFDALEAELSARLAGLRREETLTVAGEGGILHQPHTLAELQTLVAANPQATLLAGGTDVGLWITKHLKPLPLIIHLAEVAELKGLEVLPGRIEAGAAVTWAALLPVLERHLPELAALVRRIGAEQVRNSGTLAGNIANGSPIGDGMPALLALGATLTLNRDGVRRELPLDAFYLAYRRTALAPGEFIERVTIPLPAHGERFGTWKVTKRRDQDISAVCAAFRLALVPDGTVAAFRAGYGGMAATPARAPALEAALTGQHWTAAAVTAALPALEQDFAPLSDLRAGAAYRRAVAGNLLLRFHAYTVGEEAYALETVHG